MKPGSHRLPALPAVPQATWGSAARERWRTLGHLQEALQRRDLKTENGHKGAGQILLGPELWGRSAYVSLRAILRENNHKVNQAGRG